MTHALKTLMELRERYLNGDASHGAFFAAVDRDLPKVAEYVKRLEDALRPFAASDLLDDISDSEPDTRLIGKCCLMDYECDPSTLTVGDVRRARSALNQSE